MLDFYEYMINILAEILNFNIIIFSFNFTSLIFWKLFSTNHLYMIDVDNGIILIIIMYILVFILCLVECCISYCDTDEN
jgi:hypothetical protein